MSPQRPSFRPAAPIKPMINLGALLDIPTGIYVKGLHGESILNGGLGYTTGIVGRPNHFKSTIEHYMMLSALDKVTYATDDTSSVLYDTEVNISRHQLHRLTQRFDRFQDRDILQEDLWQVTDKTQYWADEWYDVLRDYLKERKKEEKKRLIATPFIDRDLTSHYKILPPVFSEVDSFTEFESEDVADMLSGKSLGDSGNNTVHMRSGLVKNNFLMDLPHITGGYSHYMLNAAHIGTGIDMATGPMSAPPPRPLQHLKGGEKIKGVTGKYLFLMANCWYPYNAALLINDTTKACEYPRNPDENAAKGDTDLNLVSMRQLRSKSGPSGYVIELVVSQSEGVLPELTEFHYLRDKKNYGVSGTWQSGLFLDLCPDIKFQRTTIRSKIDQEPRLRRALNITAELLQMHLFWRHFDLGELCTPQELFDDLKAQGYDWDELLSTRGWWTLENDKQSIPFLSTWDLLAMRPASAKAMGLSTPYKPYWKS